MDSSGDTTAMGFVIPGDINLPTGGYTYDRRVMALLPKCGVSARHVALPGGFPFPSRETLAETERILKALPDDLPLLIDGLAFGALPAEIVTRIAQPIIALVHHPLYLETGLTPAQHRTLHLTEKTALMFAQRVIGVSPSTIATLTDDLAVPAAKIALAPPGTDAARRARGTGRPLQILSVGSVVPRKAHDVLVRALARVEGVDWRLTIAGAQDLSPEANAALTRALAETGIGAKVQLLGALSQSDLDALYDRADLFVLASLHEGFGMVLTEALARSLPIVCTTGGASASTAPDAAARKVPPGDVPALADAIATVAKDEDLRQRMRDAAWEAAKGLWRWEDTARVIAGVVHDTKRERT